MVALEEDSRRLQEELNALKAASTEERADRSAEIHGLQSELQRVSQARSELLEEQAELVDNHRNLVEELRHEFTERESSLKSRLEGSQTSVQELRGQLDQRDQRLALGARLEASANRKQK